MRNTADADGIGLDGADGLCIDGEPLVRTSGTHLQPGAKYRTLRESHARITIEGTAASPWFEVELPDGRVREYGRTADSELRFAVVSVGRVTYTLPLLWSINKETDAFGNEMRYEYKEVESLGARHPKRIVYGDDADAEVVFEYTGRGDVDTMTVGGRTQRQWLRLHRLAVRLDGRDVREYRLESERTTEGWLRLRKVQLCGWRDAGAGTKECLKPLSVTWEKPASAVPHMKTCVASVDDPLGRRTSFARGVLKSSGTHGFLFTTTEQGLFGAGTAPANAAALAANGSGNIKPVVTTVSRDNGIGGTHETTYAYQGRGWRSTRNWGFLYCYAAGPLCQAAAGGGFTNVTQALTSWNMSWRIPIFATVTWGRVSFGVGGSLWSGEGGGFFGRGGFFRPRVTLRIGLPFPVFTSAVRLVSLGREASSADWPMISDLLAYWPVFTREELVSIGVGSVPVVGTVQSVVEVVSGRDYITDERVNRGVAAVGIVVGVVPGGKGALKAGTKVIGKFGPRGGRLTLRKRMEAEDPPPFPGAEAHHDLAQAFRKDFERAGLDIDDPAHGRWVGDKHKNWSWEFGQEWHRFFRTNPDPTAEEILAKMEALRATGKYK
ncbi:MAG: pre-toxin TG domain-containing protein [Gammaproteobacteria bacterium]|nr:pre-toxin TG domain-containing protein [Gammaproteobacteria bacterium]